MPNPKSSLVVALLTASFAYQPSSNTAPPSATTTSGNPQPAGGRTVNYANAIEIKNWPLLTLTQSFGDGPEATRLLEKSPLKFIVAAVPDPQNSHYPIIFDRLMESIQRGLEDSQYTLDRFWLPWDSEPGPVDPDFVVHEQHEEWLARRQSYPGVLVFRQTKTADRICVFIVGETPEAGINRKQFSNALQIMEKRSDWKQLQILGPTFSGSIDSVGRAITEAAQGLPRHDHFNVVTGTATSGDNETRLKQAAPSVSFHFKSMIGTDDKAIKMFERYTRDKLGESYCGRIAFLTESGTTYAQSLKKTQSGCSIKNFHYPMQISRMRNAYGKNTELEALSQSKIGDTPKQGLVVPLKDEHEGSDLIPTFSTELRPISQEASLLNVLATISQSRIEAVGIVATDVLDALFLGRMLKDHCPNVRPFILDSDLIYGHSSQNNVFDGMLIISTYPLIRKLDQFYSSSILATSDTRQFSSAVEEGEYWATLEILSSLNATTHARGPHVDSPWLAVMGRDGIWPIQEPDSHEANALPQPRPTQSVGWRLFFFLSSIFCLVFATAAIYFNSKWSHDIHSYRQTGENADGARAAAPLNSPVEVGFSTEDDVAEEPELPVKMPSEHVPLGWLAALRVSSLDTKVILTLAFVLLVTTYAFVTLIEMRSKQAPAYLGAVTCVATFSALFGAIHSCWRPLQRWQPVAAFVIASALFCAAINYLFPASNAFVYRALHVGNGVSPVVPMFFMTAALFWLACANLNRIRLCNLFPQAANSFEGDPFLRHAHKLQEDLKVILQSCTTGSYFWPAAAFATLIFSLAMFNPTRIFSLETFHFEWIYSLGLYWLYFGLLVESIRFWRVWNTLHGILQMLERHKICKAFKRLPSELSPASLWRWGGGGPSFAVFAHFLNRLRRLSNQQVARNAEHTYVEHVKRLQKDARILEGLISPVYLIKGATLRTMNNHLTLVVTDLVNAMSHEWGAAKAAAAAVSAGGHSSLADAGGGLEFSSETRPIAEELVALRFVDLIAQVNQQLKNSVEFIAGALILAVISLNSYPFEPHRSLTSILTIYFFGAGAAFLLVFLQMSRNKIISYLNATTPGKLDGNVFQLISLGGLPFITVISSQFPAVGGFLFAWVKPALEALR